MTPTYTGGNYESVNVSTTCVVAAVLQESVSDEKANAHNVPSKIECKITT